MFERQIIPTYILSISYATRTSSGAVIKPTSKQQSVLDNKRFRIESHAQRCSRQQIKEQLENNVRDLQYCNWKERCGEAVNRDAQKYYDMLNANTQFVDCAICGVEESFGKVED